jgi:biopolymer transport protein ExbB/TolQ
MLLLIILLLLSLAANVILIWYVRRVIQTLKYGVENVEELQKLLNDYADLLAPVAEMEEFYRDPAILSAVANTKLIISACRVYKQTLIRDHDEEETQEQAYQEQEDKKERKAKATISSVKA